MAVGAQVDASTVEGGYWLASYATDGDANTRWASEFSDDQWIRVDLGSTRTITNVVLSWEAAYGKGYQVQVSDNGSDWTTVFTEANGNGGIDDLAVNAAGRYVRMLGTERGTGYGYSLWSFEVY
jgi:hypothetical protein